VKYFRQWSVLIPTLACPEISLLVPVSVSPTLQSEILRSLGFRSYADYMMTAEFREAVQELLSLATRFATAIMCAERFYWKCHRRILSDSLVAHGVSVLRIIETDTVKPHSLTPDAVIRQDGSILYPSPRLE